MSSIFKHGLIIVVLAVTMPLVFGWLPLSILTPSLTVVIGAGLVAAIIAFPILFVLLVIGSSRRR